MKQRKLSSKAYDWAIRLQAGDIRELELDEYLDWVESNPQEAEGVEELGSLWEELAFAEVDPPLSLQGHTAYRPHVFFGVIEMIRMLFTPSSVVALLTIFTIASISTFFLIEDESGVVYQTARAEMTTVNLADGSTAHMNVLSKIRVSFSDNERHIILDEGEVSFDVFPDSNRPFIVSIDDSEVYALGTEFNVKLNQERALSVILVEGRIRVSTNLNGEQGVVTEILSEPGEQAQILPVFLNPRGRSQLLQTSIDVSIKEIA
ncbi:FecR domain-containing protein, partial [Gammaproteobacteria bacterium AH-315-E17]|nr:FecR domain-containing protein [Gammaproteobacteria bacterium AH-315-E17]